MTSPFVPEDGERARWTYCYELVVAKQPGEHIEYLEVEELLDCTRVQAQQAMIQAKRHLENDRQRTVRAKRKYGWEVLSAAGNLGEVDSRVASARRKVTRAARLHNATPREELSQVERSRHDFQARQLLGAQSLYNRKSKSFAELEQKSQQQQTQLPWRKGSDGPPRS